MDIPTRMGKKQGFNLIHRITGNKGMVKAREVLFSSEEYTTWLSNIIYPENVHVKFRD